VVLPNGGAVRIGIDASLIAPGRMGGLTTYVVELVRALLEKDTDDDYTIFRSPDLRSVLDVRAARLRYVDAPTCVDDPVQRMGVLHVWLPAQARKHRVEVLHHTANLACVPSGFRSVLTLHDLIPRYYLETIPGSSVKRPFFSYWLRLASARLAHE